MRLGALAATGLIAVILAPAFQVAAQTSETFKRVGPIPYGEYLRRTGQSAPKGRRAVRPRAAVPKGAPVASSPALAAPPLRVTAPPPPVAAPARPSQVQPPPAPASRPAAPLPTAVVAVGPYAPLPPGELEAFVDGAVRQGMEADHLAGVAVVVVQDGRVVLEKGYGLARLSPAAPVDPQRTLFRLGSVSKVLTWIEVLKQVERGRLNPDAPIDDALPENLRLGPGALSDPVRLRHLMTHTAGFESRELGRLFTGDPRELAGTAAALSKPPRRVREPGRLASYSSYGAALAGAAASAVARVPFDKLMEDDLLRPAGLGSTSFREPYPEGEGRPEPLAPALADRLAQGSWWNGRSLTPRSFAYGQDMAPAVSASSSAHDMGRLMTLLLSPEEGAAVGVGPRISGALFTRLQRSAPGLPGWTYGLQERPLAGGVAGFGHSGAAPGFAAEMVMAPQLRLGVFVATNTEGGSAFARRLPQDLVRRFFAGRAAAEPVQALAEPGRYAGRYLSTRRAYGGLESFVDRLLRTERVSVGDDGRLALSAADGRVRQFVPLGDDRFRAVDGDDLIAFNADREGAKGRRLLIDPAAGEAAARTGAISSPLLLAWAAGLTVTAALLGLVATAGRDWRDYRQTRAQALAGGVQAVGGVAWLVAVAAFLVFLRGARDPAHLMYAWPNAWLTTASWAALVAAALTALQLWQLLGVWADAHRLKEWSLNRKLAHSLTTLVFATLAFLLWFWGGLTPWSS